jgi:hypothetical protein
MQEQHDGQHDREAQDILLVAGGIALIAMGVGMLMTNPALRRSLLAGLAPMLPELTNPTAVVNQLLPDVERYMKLRNM